MASAQVLPNNSASSRKQEHLEAGKRRVCVWFCSLKFWFFFLVRDSDCRIRGSNFVIVYIMHCCVLIVVIVLWNCVYCDSNVCGLFKWREIESGERKRNFEYTQSSIMCCCLWGTSIWNGDESLFCCWKELGLGHIVANCMRIVSFLFR